MDLAYARPALYIEARPQNHFCNFCTLVCDILHSMSKYFPVLSILYFTLLFKMCLCICICVVWSVVFDTEKKVLGLIYSNIWLIVQFHCYFHNISKTFVNQCDISINTYLIVGPYCTLSLGQYYTSYHLPRSSLKSYHTFWALCLWPLPDSNLWK